MDNSKLNCEKALLSPLWESNAHSPTPGPRSGHHWQWQDIYRYISEAAKLTSPDVVERRVLRLMNPDPVSDSDESTVGNLAAAIQILLPGEKARPHRHSIHALRFILEGQGATTIVNGVPVAMNPGDMLLTPGGCWHEHSHEGDEPSIWLDVLDAPVHNALGIITFEPGPVAEGQMPSSIPIQAFKAPGVLPSAIQHDHAYSPVFSYPYADVVKALEYAPVGPAGWRAVRYSNPLTGGAAMSTIDIHMLKLEPGLPGKEYRCNADNVYLVVDGEGESQIGDKSVAWSKYDILSVPRNNWFRHTASTEAHLLQVSDSELLRRLDLLEEGYRDGKG